MVESALTELRYFEEVGFEEVKISVKASNVSLMVEAYRQLSAVTDHPLHLGVTEAGPPPTGLIKSTAGIASLLLEGIGDHKVFIDRRPSTRSQGWTSALGGFGATGAKKCRSYRLSQLRTSRN